MRSKIGIYFCLNQNTIIYIGKTTKYPLRIKNHYQQAMPITSCRFIPCEKDLLDYYEDRWIKRFKPHFNIQLKPKLEKRDTSIRPIKLSKFFIRMKFRKMTRKSIIGYGSYKHQTVERMLKFKPFDLVKMYFKLSQITFFDDILDELGITNEWRINKSGTEVEKYLQFMEAKHPEALEKRIQNYRKKSFKDSVETLKQMGHNDSRKSYHQSFNHNHR